MFKKFFLLSISLFGLLTTVTSSYNLESRAIQNFGVNCLLNRYIQHEFELGFNYLNASIYMRRDTVALHGFGKMFNKFWLKQIDHVNNLNSFVVKRGGAIETPGYVLKSNLNSINHFENETTIIKRFLDLEKNSNKILLELHKATSYNLTEIRCISKFNTKQNRLYSSPNEIDPYTASFLDEHLLINKVERIKYLADIYRKVLRFDKHIHGTDGHVIHTINPLGIHIFDKELQEQFQ